jgi:hypothetical protein
MEGRFQVLRPDGALLAVAQFVPGDGTATTDATLLRTLRVFN